MSGRSKRRFVPVVDAYFQWKYTAIITGFGVVLATGMSALVYRAQRINSRLLELEGAYEAQVAAWDAEVLWTLLAGVAAMGVALLLWGLFITHRIVGPIALASRYLRDIEAGRWPAVRPLRKRDEMRELFASLEAAVASLRARDDALAADLADGSVDALARARGRLAPR
jgi:hypothetical protein